LAKWMMNNVPKRGSGGIPVARFLVTNTHDEIKPEGPPDDLYKAMHFKNMGQVFMRSGSGPDDTYALFTAGGILEMHRQYDNNNFVIFKKGFLALNSGTRPEPGIHLSHYYCRTVAHNCILIKMPGEKMPFHWGNPAPGEEPLPVPNDGGQNDLMGSEVIAFSENDHYVYIAGDATESYNEEKANLVLRQFVFLPPDHFVIFDRVKSTHPDYTKTWLLHTANEPEIKADEFSAGHWEGRLFCKTLLPEDAELTKIGGPGKQFWSDGRNWSMPPGSKSDTIALLGQWRVEVTPGKSCTDDIFLHLIQVRDTSLKSMPASWLLRKHNMQGVGFKFRNKEYEVMFAIADEAGGKITISQNGQKIVDETFTNQVQHQKSYY
jgi:hypothetical protein